MPEGPRVTTHHLLRRTIALVLAAGRGNRLGPLTEHQAKPALPFGGKFRVIDFALSNCLNSGIRRIGVITQYKSQTLVQHLQRGWSFLRSELHEMVEVLPAQQRTDEGGWYSGTADAIFQNLDILQDTQAPHDYVIVLPGDHVAKMDYSILLREHVDYGGGCTVACAEVPLAQARSLGVLSVAQDRRVTAFDEKPAQPAPLPHRSDMALVSMGIYVFDARYLYELLETAHAEAVSFQDFGQDILPRAVAAGRLFAHPFALSSVSRVPRALGEAPYWRTVSTIDEYWAANLDLAAVIPKLDIYDTDWPVWTDQQQLPPAKFVMDLDGDNGVVVNTIVSGGCIVAGSMVKDCVLFSNVRIESFCDLLEVVLLPDVQVGAGCRLRRAVIDSGCVLPAGLSVGDDPQEDALHFERSTAGVVLVTREALARRALRVPAVAPPAAA